MVHSILEWLFSPGQFAFLINLQNAGVFMFSHRQMIDYVEAWSETPTKNRTK